MIDTRLHGPKPGKFPGTPYLGSDSSKHVIQPFSEWRVIRPEPGPTLSPLGPCWFEGDFATGIRTNVIVRSWMVKAKVRLLNLRVIRAERALQGVPRLMRDLFGPSQPGPRAGHQVP
jgi:hypothetical protein